MANNFVITIARQYGSGGRKIGQAVADALDIPYYDQQLLEFASDESGISLSLFGKADETAPRGLEALRLAARHAHSADVLPPTSGEFTSDRNLFNYQAKIIRELADNESCVIIGRCADYLLDGRPNVLRVYIHASDEYRLGMIATYHPQFDEKEARRCMEEIDGKRGKYYRFFTGSDWTDAAHFDVSLNAGALGMQGCVERIRQLLPVFVQEDK